MSQLGGTSQPLALDSDEDDVPNTVEENQDPRGDPTFTLVPQMPADCTDLNLFTNSGDRIKSFRQLLDSMQAGELVGQWNEVVNDVHDDEESDILGSPMGEGISKQFLNGFYLECLDTYIGEKAEDLEFALLQPEDSMRSDHTPIHKAEFIAYNIVTDAEFLRRELNVDSDGRPWWERGNDGRPWWERGKKDKYIFKITLGGPKFHVIDGTNPFDNGNYTKDWFTEKNWVDNGEDTASLYKLLVFRRFQLVPYILNKMMGKNYYRPEYLDNTGAPSFECIIRNQLRAVKVGMTSWSIRDPTTSLSRRYTTYKGQGKTFYAAFAANIRVFVEMGKNKELREVPYTWCDKHLKTNICELYESKLHQMFFSASFMVAKPPLPREYLSTIKVNEEHTVYERIIKQHPKKEEVLYIDGNKGPEWIYIKMHEMFKQQRDKLNLLRYGGSSFYKRLINDNFTPPGGPLHGDFLLKLRDFYYDIQKCKEESEKPAHWPETRTDNLSERKQMVDEQTTLRMGDDDEYRDGVEDVRGLMKMDKRSERFVSEGTFTPAKMTKTEYDKWYKFELPGFLKKELIILQQNDAAIKIEMVNATEVKRQQLKKQMKQAWIDASVALEPQMRKIQIALLKQPIFHNTPKFVCMDGTQSVRNSFNTDVQRLKVDAVLKNVKLVQWRQASGIMFDEARRRKAFKAAIPIPIPTGGFNLAPDPNGMKAKPTIKKDGPATKGGGTATKGGGPAHSKAPKKRRKTSAEKWTVPFEKMLENLKLKF